MNIFKSKGLFLSLGILISGIGIHTTMASSESQINSSQQITSDTIRGLITSGHTRAFAKETFFSSSKKNDITNKEFNKWQETIDATHKYIRENALNSKGLISALESSLKANTEMMETWKKYYDQPDTNTLFNKLTSINSNITDLKETQIALLKAEKEINKKFTGKFKVVRNKAEKTATKRVLIHLIATLETTIGKMIKDYNTSLAREKASNPPPARSKKTREQIAVDTARKTNEELMKKEQQQNLAKQAQQEQKNG
ncbi:MAG: hypothetical protein NT124_05400 [Candidatus Dependentiae bacterium]|nr:hypothetical protein [Candidatus Dependentiae bacterium]